jgi:hypothetical protein
MSILRSDSTGVCVTSIVQRQRRPAISTSSEVLSIFGGRASRRTAARRFMPTQCAIVRSRMRLALLAV